MTKPPIKAIIILILPVAVLTTALSMGTALLFYSLQIDKVSFSNQYYGGFISGVAILNLLAVLFLLIFSSFYRPTTSLWRYILTVANIPPAIIYIIYFSSTLPIKL